MKLLVCLSLLLATASCVSMRLDPTTNKEYVPSAFLQTLVPKPEYYRDRVSNDLVLSTEYLQEPIFGDIAVKVYDTFLDFKDGKTSLVKNFGLEQFEFPFKADLKDYLRKYLGQIETKLAAENPERLRDFKIHAPKLTEFLLGKYYDYITYFRGPSNNVNGLVMFNYIENGVPVFVYLKDGIELMARQ